MVTDCRFTAMMMADFHSPDPLADEPAKNELETRYLRTGAAK